MSCHTAIRRLPLVLAILLAGLAPVSLALSAAAPDGPGPVVVIAAPWADGSPVMDRARGVVLAHGRLAPIAFGFRRSDSFHLALAEAGAWFSLDARLSGALCSPGKAGK